MLYVSGNSSRGSVSTQMGVMGREMGGRFKRDGTYVYLWLIHAEVGWKTAKFYKAIILQLKKNKKNFKKGYVHPNVDCSTIYNSQDTGTIYMSINRGMGKEDVVSSYNGILLGHKKVMNLGNL